MKPTIYKFKNFKIIITAPQACSLLQVSCTLEGKTYTREYAIPDEITSLVMDEEYVYLNYNDSGLTGYDNDSQYVIKFEGDSGLVIDTYDSDGEHKDIVGCHDFWDEV